MFKKCIYLLFILGGTFFGVAQYVNAQETEISENGSGSVNQTTVERQSQHSINQSNSGELNTTVTSSSNTGGNTANGNTGSDTSITTGDTSTSTEVKNENINLNVANPPCCNETNIGSSVQGNGSDSTNTTVITEHKEITVTSQNNANIQNNINVKASTGGNNANNNNGQVKIETGHINIENKIVNKNVNQSLITIPKNSYGDISLDISKNGADSVNNIQIEIDEKVILAQVNSANINNNVNIDANTGGNNANDNVGKVTIKTGNIDIDTTIINKDINNNVVNPPKDDDPEGPNNPPTTPPTTVEPGRGGSSTSSSSSSSGGTGGGQVLGASTTGDVLPATGGNLLIALIANILTFLFGFYLRKRAGRSPSR